MTTTYLKISWVFAVLYLFAAASLPLFDYAPDFASSLIGHISSCWGPDYVSPVCFQVQEIIAWKLWYVPFYGLILSCIVSAITGVVSGYQAVRSHHKREFLIVLYAAVNVLAPAIIFVCILPN